MENKVFKTKEEAKKALKVNTFTPKWFCPLISGECNKHCVCFKKPFILGYFGSGNFTTNKPDGWVIKDGCCNNAMFNR